MPLVKDWMLSIGLLEAEITFLLTDFELWIRNKTEFAYKRLLRAICVDRRLQLSCGAQETRREL